MSAGICGSQQRVSQIPSRHFQQQRAAQVLETELWVSRPPSPAGRLSTSFGYKRKDVQKRESRQMCLQSTVVSEEIRESQPHWEAQFSRQLLILFICH